MFKFIFRLSVSSLNSWFSRFVVVLYILTKVSELISFNNFTYGLYNFTTGIVLTYLYLFFVAIIGSSIASSFKNSRTTWKDTRPMIGKFLLRLGMFILINNLFFQQERSFQQGLKIYGVIPVVNDFITVIMIGVVAVIVGALILALTILYEKVYKEEDKKVMVTGRSG